MTAGAAPVGPADHTYPFHVEVAAPSRAAANAWLRQQLRHGYGGLSSAPVTVSEHTAGLVDAIEERAAVNELRALIESYPETSSSRDDDRADAYDELLAAIRDRIAELTGE